MNPFELLLCSAVHNQPILSLFTKKNYKKCPSCRWVPMHWLIHSTDIWADALLNKSEHASDSLSIPHALFAQELTKIADNSGVLSTCVESHRFPLTLSWRRNRLQTSNQHANEKIRWLWQDVESFLTHNEIFSADTRWIMDVTIGHVFDTHHSFKPNTLRSIATSKCLEYAEHYQR